MEKQIKKFKAIRLLSVVAIISLSLFIFNCKNKKATCLPPEITSVDTESVFQNKVFKYFKITIKTKSESCNGNLLFSIENGREGSWQSNNEFINVLPGSYKIAVKNQNDSITRKEEVIVWDGFKGESIEPPVPTISMHAKVETHNETCVNCNNGKIVILAKGGEPPYEYSIDKGKKYSANNTFTNLAPAVYNISFRDKNGKIYTHTLPVKIEKVPNIIPKISKSTIEKSLNELASKRDFNLMDSMINWFESENIIVKGTIKTKKEYTIYRYLYRLVYDGPAGSIKLRVESVNYNDKNRINDINITEL